jgi:uncharacterized protein YqgC (DUF456 family)
MIYAYVIGLTILNVLFWIGILFNLPGAWLMILGAALLEWWTPEQTVFGTAVLVGTTALATLGEILEFVLGARGARKAGGSKRGAVLAIIGGIVGAVLGTPLAPILGTLIGACLGAFAGSLLGDLWAGRPLGHSMESGRGAAVGRLWGTIAKLGIGAAIVAALAVAPFVGNA